MKGRESMRELLAGDGFERALKEFGVTATRTFRRTNFPDDGYYHECYEVWEIDDENYEKLNAVTAQQWNETDDRVRDESNFELGIGWWRYSEGANIRSFPIMRFLINGHPITAFFNDDNMQSWLRHAELFDEERWSDEKLQAAKKSYVDCHTQYPDLLSYSIGEFGASNEKNFCSIAVEVANLNNMKMSQLMELTMN